MKQGDSSANVKTVQAQDEIPCYEMSVNVVNKNRRSAAGCVFMNDIAIRISYSPYTIL